MFQLSICIFSHSCTIYSSSIGTIFPAYKHSGWYREMSCEWLPSTVRGYWWGIRTGYNSWAISRFIVITCKISKLCVQDFRGRMLERFKNYRITDFQSSDAVYRRYSFDIQSISQCISKMCTFHIFNSTEWVNKVVFSESKPHA